MRVDFYGNVVGAEGIAEGFIWDPAGARNANTWWTVTRGKHTYNVKVKHSYRSGPLRMDAFDTLTSFTVWRADQSRAAKPYPTKAEAESAMLRDALSADDAVITEVAAWDRYEDVGGKRRIVRHAWSKADIPPLTEEVLSRAAYATVEYSEIRAGQFRKANIIH